MSIWQWLFAPWEYASTAGLPAAEQRGAYLVRHLGHCGECHTPRNIFGALNVDNELAGSPKGSPAGGAPNLTSDPDRGIGRWSAADLEFFLEVGMKPDGDFAGGGMAAVVDENTALLSKENRAAITAFLRSLPSP
jgi:mono/diheme cytochrome c family protein